MIEKMIEERETEKKKLKERIKGVKVRGILTCAVDETIRDTDAQLKILKNLQAELEKTYVDIHPSHLRADEMLLKIIGKTHDEIMKVVWKGIQPRR